jgi:flagella basal body P-ring formation protein FlgA
MIPIALFALSGCIGLSPDSDQIRARDLAAVLPAWASVPGDAAVTPAPIPGVERVLRVAELRRLGARWNVAPEAERDLCFAIPVSQPDPARILAAMRRQLPEARIEILESSRQPVPDGALEFPITGLHATEGGGYWNGFVSYGRGQRFVIWARVKVAVSAKRVVAAQDLKPGQPIDAAQLRVETVQGIPGVGGFLSTIATAVGRTPRRTIASGTALRPEWLESPKEIQRGETVQVEAIHGGVHLHLEGVAQTSGAVGETISIENSVSKRRFIGRVEGKGKVIVKGII